MKRCGLVAIAMLVICNLAIVKGENRVEKRYFSHSTYSVPGRFDSDRVTHKNNYKNFDFLYVMALPKWSVSDFDLSQDEINKIYIEEFDYDTVEASNRYDSKDQRRGMAQVPELIENVHKTDCKILCSFPGKKYDEIARDPQRRIKFARMMAAFCQKYDYDGIELDWEGTVTEVLHLAFMTDIRAALDDLNLSKRLYLTTALATGHKYTQQQADDLSAVVDWINIMSYDMGGGPWVKSGVVSYNTSLKSLKEHMERKWSVFAPDKICIGLANYGYGYRGIAPDTRFEATQIGDDFCFTVSYSQLEEYIEDGWVERWSDEHQSSYYFSPNSDAFFSIDTPRAIEAKIKWAYEMGYKGVFWWEYFMDIDPSTKDDKQVKHLLMDGAVELIDSYNK